MARARRPPTVRKSIYDPVHGPIVLRGLSVDLIGTPAFQRLWGIRQTGFAHLVFPGANHTRLEHSLGTFWVAQRLGDRLELDDDRRGRLEAGALLHDLGHPPFSHTLEPSLREVHGFGHERRSRLAIDGTGSDGGEVASRLERAGQDPKEIADLIDPGGSRRSADLLGSLLHGAIDADRLDYLQRDAYYTGVALGAIDAVRLLDTVMAHRGRVAFAAKAQSAVQGFLVGRSLMYSAVYYHKTVRAAELLAQAALERSVGYPDTARPILAGDDGDFFHRLAADPSRVSRDLIGRLRQRRLPKRVHALQELAPAEEGPWRRLLANPRARRAFEDSLADRCGGTPGSLLVDLGGIEPRDARAEDGRAIALVDEGRARFPFRASRPWTELARRPPSEVRVAIYASPELRARAERRLARLGRVPE